MHIPYCRPVDKGTFLKINVIVTQGGEGGLGRDANFSMNFGPFLNYFASESRFRWSKRRSLATHRHRESGAK